MKRCPTCDKTFDDAMRFCQADGTPLVEAADPVDPYKTMVARPEDIAAAIPPAASGKDEDEVLEIPAGADPLKTMYASEEEIRSAMASKDADNQVMDIPPLVESQPLDPPAPSVADAAPPSPFAVDPPKPQSPSTTDFPGDPFAYTTPPIPSPFNEPAPPAYEPPAPAPPKFIEPEPAYNPFEQVTPEVNAPIEKTEWTPPVAQEQSWQDKSSMQNPQYQPGSGLPPGGKQNQTLAIVSLVLGILGLTICCGSVLPSLAAAIIGFMAKGKATNDPANFGGKGLALGGIITGILGTVVGIAYLIFIFFLGGMQIIMQNMR